MATLRPLHFVRRWRLRIVFEIRVGLHHVGTVRPNMFKFDDIRNERVTYLSAASCHVIPKAVLLFSAVNPVSPVFYTRHIH
jgi:hypothetical protein